MGDIKLFSIRGKELAEISGESFEIEKTLQGLLEHNLERMLGVRFLASEYSTGKTHGGRIDTLGIDEIGSPIIIEYKRASNENVINQGLYYLDWLLDHKAEFTMLVGAKFGQDEQNSIDWSSARLICIANQFLKYDEYAVKQIDRNIELFQYKKYGSEFIMLELVNATQSSNSYQERKPHQQKLSNDEGVFEKRFSELGEEQLNLYGSLKAYMVALGDDVQINRLKLYEAYKRITNFACLEVHPHNETIVIFLRLDPQKISLEDGFSRDVSNIGHWGTGDLEITIRNRDSLERAMPLIRQAYEKN